METTLLQTVESESRPAEKQVREVPATIDTSVRRRRGVPYVLQAAVLAALTIFYAPVSELSMRSLQATDSAVLSVSSENDLHEILELTPEPQHDGLLAECSDTASTASSELAAEDLGCRNFGSPTHLEEREGSREIWSPEVFDGPRPLPA